MVRNNNFFIISGFISITLFLLFFFAFIHLLFSSKKLDVYALKKDNYISISLDMSLPKIKKHKKSAVVKHQVSQKAQVLPKQEIPAQDIDVGDLFSDVWTKKIKKKKVKKSSQDIKRLQEIEKRVQTLKNNDVENISKIVQNVDKASVEEEQSSASTSNEVNEYLAKIQALVYEHFFPPQNSQGNSVKAVIELSGIGKVLDFRILNYSANSALNDECDRIKDRLIGVLFPVNPQNRSGNYIIILKSKE